MPTIVRQFTLFVLLEHHETRLACRSNTVQWNHSHIL